MVLPVMRCKICSANADCVGFYFEVNVPKDNPRNADEFYCNAHCEHDRCASVKERLRDGYFESGGGYFAKPQ